jgi:O-antigen/teichoic acid export membrane protein
MVLALAVSNLSASIIPAVSATTIKFISQAVTEEEGARMGRILAASATAVLAIDALLLLATALFRPMLSGVIFGGHALKLEPQLGSILLLSVGAVCIQQIDGVFAAVLKGLERFKQQSIVEVLSRTSQVLAAIVTAWFYRDIRVVLAAYCIVCAIFAGARWIVMRRALGNRCRISLPNRSDVGNLLRFGGWMWLNAAATIAFGTVDRIVVGRASGPSVVAEYNIYMQLSQLVHFIPASVFAFTFPLFSRLWAGRQFNMTSIRDHYGRYFRATLIVGCGLGISLVILKLPILSLFGGAVLHDQNKPAFLILVASYVILSFNVIPYFLGLGSGNAKTVSLITSISMFASIIAIICLTPSYGMLGAALGRLVYGIGSLMLIIEARNILRPQ